MNSGGFSLLELLVVLLILGIFLLLAIPQPDPDRRAVDQAAWGLSEQVVRARLEAIRNNVFAGVHLFTDGAGGYAVFLDLNANRVYDPGEEVQLVRFGQGDWARVALAKEKSTLGNLPLLFDPRGIPAKIITGTWALKSSSGYVRKVVVSQQGRARVE